MDWGAEYNGEVNVNNGHPRNLTTPHETMGKRNTSTSGRRESWRNLTDPYGTPLGGRYALESTFFRTLGTLGPLVLPFPPFPNTRRFGGFETPGMGWLIEYRSDDKDYGLMGTTDHRGT